MVVCEYFNPYTTHCRLFGCDCTFMFNNQQNCDCFKEEKEEEV